MWGTVFGVGLLGALNPVVLGVVLLLLSRPRPVASLFVYWLGLLVTNMPAMLIPLLLLHHVPAFRGFVEHLDPAVSPGTRMVLAGLGALMLTIAAVLIVRPWMSRRTTQVAATGGPTTPNDAAPAETAGGEALLDSLGLKKNGIGRRIAARVQGAWESDDLWIAFLLGMVTFIAPEAILLVDSVIVLSGSSIGVQIIAAITFLLVAFALFEIVLIGYLLSPERVRVVVTPIHDRTRAYRRQILAAILLFVGGWQLAVGLGIA